MTVVPQFLLQQSFNPITEVSKLSAPGGVWKNREVVCQILGALVVFHAGFCGQSSFSTTRLGVAELSLLLSC